MNVEAAALQDKSKHVSAGRWNVTCVGLSLRQNSLRSAPTSRTAVTLHRWASYILLAHGVGYMGLLTDASTVHTNIACSCFGVQPAQDPKNVKGINETVAARVRQPEVGIITKLIARSYPAGSKTIIHSLFILNRTCTPPACLLTTILHCPPHIARPASCNHTPQQNINLTMF